MADTAASGSLRCIVTPNAFAPRGHVSSSNQPTKRALPETLFAWREDKGQRQAKMVVLARRHHFPALGRLPRPRLQPRSPLAGPPRALIFGAQSRVAPLWVARQRGPLHKSPRETTPHARVPPVAARAWDWLVALAGSKGAVRLRVIDSRSFLDVRHSAHVAWLRVERPQLCKALLRRIIQFGVCTVGL